ncbi:uncharacterized protein LOC129910094 [Episyrphus balteatus]|uniref:uncharacterized protein LOC129910094 n=1 Tax=Episyrphus balteatus TaxID=286459 RepID=UPI0024865FAD|nr:uncharacterized protein LOC129910094 [Episyrphus balteatus]
MDETRNSVKDPTEVKNALAKYLELFTSHSNFFKFFIAQNGVLEWFGRSIKGNTKIHDYLRYEVCSQYDHLFFENAEPCEPFECKSTHMETKSLPTQSDKNLNNSSFDLEKTNSIEEDVSMSTDVVEFTTTKDRRGSITPPSSAKRVKLDQDLNRSISPPMLNVEDYFDKKETNVKLIVPRSSRNCFETPDSTYVSTAATTSSQVQYSELKYFEAIGILRSCLQPEHKNFRLSSTLNANGSWDRETKIQISYRIRLDDNDVQFALIIYKNLHSYSALSKRNLMSEFDEVATHKRLAAEENKNGSTSSTKTTTTNSQKEKRKIGRRLRLF